uniref:HPS6 biosis of lysosomal organelles complex 2 subunit 3 n=1 Tax=Callorhinchus milii TaxID=7868 RepID=A0A4W3IY04_CALMI
MQRCSLLCRVSDLSHFSRHQQLLRVLSGAQRIKCSADLKHLCVYLTAERKLLTFDGHRVPGQAPRPLDTRFSQDEELLDILLLGPGLQPHGASLATLVTPRGRAEVWRDSDSRGWELVQSVDLCNSPRARVVSVAGDGQSVIWCEERPPSGVHPSPGRNLHQYCVCRRAIAVGRARVSLGAISIVLHNSPTFRVISSGDLVYLVPTNPQSGESNLTRCILIWAPGAQTLTITSPTQGPLSAKTLLPGESDFRRLVADVVGILASLPSLDVHTVTPCASLGGLLLARACGEVTWIRGNGAVSRVCSLGESLAPGTEVLMEAHQGTLVCAVGRTLHLFNTITGRKMEKVTLNAESLALVTLQQAGTIQLLTKDGVYSESGRSEEVLEHMVLEEACRYYQRRSLSSSRLTVEKLKRGGMFQAPIALCSILQSQLKLRSLSSIMAGEVQSYVSLEEVKSCIVHAPESKISQYCEGLVEEEIGRLLHTDLDGDNLTYLNSIFSSFPSKAWEAIKETWNLHQKVNGLLSARATADMWRLAVSPGPPSDPQVANGATPVFELICRSLYSFRPKWLPQFVELAQQQLNHSGRSYTSKDSPENTPLYKRALSVLPSPSPQPRACQGEPTETHVAILLSSQRPNAILQAVRILIDLEQWPKVLEVAENFSRQSPLLRKELFTSLLLEFSRHRALDAYAEQLWDLCPRDTKAVDILSAILREIPDPAAESGPYSAQLGSLTVGLLRPLLARVLEWEAQCTDSSLKTLIFPPPTPPRQKKATDPSEGWTLCWGPDGHCGGGVCVL